MPSPPPLRPLPTERPIRRSQIPWGVVLAVASVLSLGALFYYYNYSKSYNAEKARILKDRRALSDEIGDEYGTLREKIEGWTVEDATKPYPGDAIDPEGKRLGWRERPSIYLRLRVADAQTLEMVHANSKLGTFDGLSSCLLHVKGSYGPWTYGEVIGRAEMLGSDFINDVRETTNDLRLKNLAFALDHYKNDDFPRAREAIRMAEYAVVALDEDPPSIPQTSLAYGADASIEQKISSVAHPIRLYVYRLGDSKELMRVRRTPDAEVVQVQGDSMVPAAGLELRRAQALSCAMANEALELVGVDTGLSMAASAGPLPQPLPSTTASASASASASAAAPASGSVAPPASASASSSK